MTREEYNKALGIGKEMRARGETKLLVATPPPIARLDEGITIVGSSTQISSVTYVAIAQVQPIKAHTGKKEKIDEDVVVTSSSQMK